METQELVSRALQLSPQDRADLVDALLLSLDDADPAVGAVWADEAMARLSAVRAGSMATFSLEEALGRDA
jgi:hypothetical protein